MDFFEKTARDIKSLKIQGATNVAKSAVNALRWKAEKSKAKTKLSLVAELEHSRRILSQTRSTEPLMRNCLRYAIEILKDSHSKNPKELSKIISRTAEELLFKIKSSNEIIAEYGGRMIKNNSVVFTHCHSSTVLNILKKAKKRGKKFSVICTETRPRFQGRITAQELAKAKIPVTMIVDSAVSTYIKHADIAFVGADLITAEMGAVNKIGTLNLAIACKRENVPFFCATTLAKFDPESLLGKREEIEFRDAKEIWEKPPKGLKLLNPAFDVTPRELINAYITEKGILTPDSLLMTAEDNMPWMFKGIKL